MIGNAIAGLYGVGVAPSTTAYESIATVTVGSGGASTVEFSSIPSTYKHLQIRGIMRNTASVGGDDIQLRVNSDTGTNYSFHYLIGDGTSASAYGLATQNNIVIGKGADAGYGSNIFTGLVIDILDYANTDKYKTLRSFAGADNNGSSLAKIGLYSGSWRSTTAINKINLYSYNLGSNNMAQYSQFALYGIKDA
jgi:hypothetical protein